MYTTQSCLAGQETSFLGEEQCPIIGISGRNSAPSLVSVGGTAPYHWCQWRNNALPLVSVGGIVLHHWYQWEELCPIIGVSGRNTVPSLVSVGGIVPHHWYPWEEQCPNGQIRARKRLHLAHVLQFGVYCSKGSKMKKGSFRYTLNLFFSPKNAYTKCSRYSRRHITSTVC
ncbi:hypothetical protein AB205_0101340 [Aquarana catesbeiana]|uniref:Uncharacterized protein n=1 Tax=Aquarana catesbeiana TaxID=8400 RepID=A0A2G9SL33_AQUCT|nr:hypothetical protein AB205_0101340 [Aquarana catesbeiana]